MRKFIKNLLLLVAISILCGFSLQVKAEEKSVVNLKIQFIGNWIFDKDNVDLYVDDVKIASLSHGVDYEGKIDTMTGKHILRIDKSNDASISTSETFTSKKESTFSATISVSKKEVRISNTETIHDSDIAESIALEESKKQAEEESRRAEQEKEEALQKELELAKSDFQKISKLDNPGDPLIQEFAENHQGEKIRFDGNIAYAATAKKKVNLLIHLGKYGAASTAGPNFEIRGIKTKKLPLYHDGEKKKAETGMNVRVLATVGEYDNTAQTITLTPIQIDYQSLDKTLIPKSSVLESKETIKRVQASLNELGYKCGNPDGVAGKKTYQAIEKFRNDCGLSADSEIDLELIEYLRVVPVEDLVVLETTAAPKKSENQSAKREIQAEEADDSDSEDMVWIPASGEKYHNKNNCGRMNPSKARKVSREYAESRGYEPCQKCY